MTAHDELCLKGVFDSFLAHHYPWLRNNEITCNYISITFGYNEMWVCEYNHKQLGHCNLPVPPQLYIHLLVALSPIHLMVPYIGGLVLEMTTADPIPTCCGAAQSP